MSRFDLNLLNALHALVTECNVTRAADKLCVTQPTMSGMLQRLRYQFGDDLLVRSGRRMELTPFAISLIAPVRQALEAVDALVHTEAAFDPATSRKSFTLMTSDYCTGLFMPRVVARLAEVAPHMRLNIVSMNAPVERLNEGEIDLCICPDDWGGIGEDTLNRDHLFHDDFVCIVSEHHPLNQNSTLEEHLAFPHVGVEMTGVSSTIDAAAWRRYAPEHEPAFTVSDFTLVPAMVVRTNFVGMVQRRLAACAAENLPIRYFSPPFTVDGVEEFLLWHPRHTAELSHRWLREILIVERNSWLREARPRSAIARGAPDQPKPRSNIIPLPNRDSCSSLDNPTILVGG